MTGRMLEKTVGFCDSHKKNNISYFKDVGPVVKAKMKGSFLSIEQERKLL